MWREEQYLLEGHSKINGDKSHWILHHFSFWLKDGWGSGKIIFSPPPQIFLQIIYIVIWKFSRRHIDWESCGIYLPAFKGSMLFLDKYCENRLVGTMVCCVENQTLWPLTLNFKIMVKAEGKDSRTYFNFKVTGFGCPLSVLQYFLIKLHTCL